MLLVLTAALVFADATVVTLALPNLLVDLHTSVYGVAAVLGVYTAAVAVAALPAARADSGEHRETWARASLLGFAAAGIACAAAPDLPVLLGARVVQGLAGAAVVTVAGSRVHERAGGRRLWVAVAVLSAAVGPVLGGALTQAFSWRAIFVAQAPVPLLAAVLWRARDGVRAEEPRPRLPARPLASLGLVSGALTALLFGVVLLLVVGWAMRPLAAALAVTLVPVAALAGSLVRGRPETRAILGAGLVAGAIGALAFLPTNDVAWLVAPELVAGLGMGLALTPLVGDLLPETTVRGRAVNLAVRHAGVTVALLVLAPLVARDLSAAVERAKLRTVAVVLDANISPGRKLKIAPGLVASVHTQRPLGAVRQDARRERRSVPASEQGAFDATFTRVEQVFVRAASEAFRWAFVVAALLALAAALVLASLRRALLAAAAVAIALAATGAQALAYRYRAPPPVAIADPCKPRTLPQSSGLGGATQSVLLRALDFAACRFHSSREELVLAIAEKSEAEKFQREHGVDVRSFAALLHLIR